MQSKSTLHFILLLIFLSSCTNSGTEGTKTTTVSVEGAGAAISALFSGFGTNQNLSSGIKNLETSQEICNNLDAGPGKVVMLGYGGDSSQTYGARSNSITVGPNDFCQDEDGNDLTEEASVGGERFALFILIDSVTGDCTQGSEQQTVSMAKGGGIVRNTDNYMPEIYGRFEIGGDIVDCTLKLDSNGNVDSGVSSCTNTSGGNVLLSSSISCNLDASINRLSVPSTLEGHYGVSTDEGLNVGYDCWQTYPVVEDSDSTLGITSDCTVFDNYGFNLASFNVGLVANSDGTIYDTSRLEELANHIKIMRTQGYSIFASVDLLYVASFNGSNWEVIADGSDFPQTLIDSTTFQSALTTKIFEIAEYLEDLNVELLSPLSEVDRVFNQSSTTNAASIYLQSILSDVSGRFSGGLVWIGQFFNSTDTATYNLTNFDYAGVNISPMPDQEPSGFLTHLQTQLGNMRTIANGLGIPYLITNAGIWGEALTSNVYDWNADASRVVDAFTMMRDESESYGASGIIFWEGATGEVVFGDYSSLSRYIAEEFGGNVSAF